MAIKTAENIRGFKHVQGFKSLIGTKHFNSEKTNQTSFIKGKKLVVLWSYNFLGCMVQDYIYSSASCGRYQYSSYYSQ